MTGRFHTFCLVCLLATVAGKDTAVPAQGHDSLWSLFPILQDRIFENTKIINFSSVFTKEPEDAADTHSPISSRSSGYSFPITQIERVADSGRSIRLEGVVFIRGDASSSAQPFLNKFFADAGGVTSAGTHYRINIRFEPAPSSSVEAVHINWLSKSELSSYSSDESKMVVGLTQLGSNIVKINPIYADARSMKSAFAKWPIDSKQLRDTIKHTRGVFAHELAHAMGLSHMRNHTNSILSYAYGRRVNAEDARAICLLVTNSDELLCPK